MCNDKLVGVYDFVEDDPSTEDVVEENTNGKDNNGHGSHVASIAAGNPVNVLVNGVINTQVSGVAPRANIISYRVCYQGEPQTADSAGCARKSLSSTTETSSSAFRAARPSSGMSTMSRTGTGARR